MAKGHDKTTSNLVPTNYDSLIGTIRSLVETARHSAARSVNALMTATYWEIGRRIVEFEQRGKQRAGYGQELLKRLAGDLSGRFGRGFAVDNLQRMRALYLAWDPERIYATLSRKSLNAEPQQVFQFSGGADWTLESLIAWLDRHIEHKDIPAGESAEFLRRVIRGLVAKFDITDLSILALDRFRLKDEVERRIDQRRALEHKAAFQMYLLPESGLTVTNDRGINFKTMVYEPSWLYEGAFQFRKHYFGAKPGELRERTSSGDPTEEFKCAQFLDNLQEVKFWVRNLARKTSSFRLQISTDWFYPDFICQLQDGRVLVVEYKGKIFYEMADSEEKRAVGAVWASRSCGKCLFEMPTVGDFAAITRLLKASKSGK